METKRDHRKRRNMHSYRNSLSLSLSLSLPSLRHLRLDKALVLSERKVTPVTFLIVLNRRRRTFPLIWNFAELNQRISIDSAGDAVAISSIPEEMSSPP